MSETLTIGKLFKKAAAKFDAEERKDITGLVSRARNIFGEGQIKSMASSQAMRPEPRALAERLSIPEPDFGATPETPFLYEVWVNYLNQLYNTAMTSTIELSGDNMTELEFTVIGELFSIFTLLIWHPGNNETTVESA